MPYRAGPEPHHHLPAVQSFHRRSDQWRRDGPSALQRWVDSSLTPSSLSIRYPRTSFQRSAVVTALIRAGDIALSSNSHRLHHVEEQLDVRQYPRIRPVTPVLRQSDLRESGSPLTDLFTCIVRESIREQGVGSTARGRQDDETGPR
jgi:hypothetical protein